MSIYREIEADIKGDINHPAAQFQYVYPYNFTTIATAFLRKYNWETRGSLTTISGVQ